MSVLKQISDLLKTEVSSSNSSNLSQEERIKNLEIIVLKSEEEIKELKLSFQDAQFSLQIMMLTNQKLAEELSIVYDILQGASGSSSKNSFSFSFREDEDDEDNWN
jgi:hypothetical protein